MAIPHTSKSVIHALQNLSHETNKHAREALLKAGLKEILKWFTLAAKNIVGHKIKLPKQTVTYMTKHKDDIHKLANPEIDEEVKRKIILKPGGGGFLGGVIIRSLLRWDGEKTARKFGVDKQRKKPSKKRNDRYVIDERFITMRKKPRNKTKTKTKKKDLKKKTPKSQKRQKQVRTMTPRKQIQFQSIPSSSGLGTPPYTASRATDLYDIAPFSPLTTVPLSSSARTALGALYSRFA